jgi:hypothetical protein
MLDNVTHILKPISRIRIKERIKNERINLNWSRPILYSYAKISRSYKYMNF